MEVNGAQGKGTFINFLFLNKSSKCVLPTQESKLPYMQLCYPSDAMLKTFDDSSGHVFR